MSRHMLSVHYVDVLPMLGIALAFLWLRLTGVGVRKPLAHAALTITGYLRPRPDPAAEHALRAAFAEFDRELSVILADRPPRATDSIADCAPRNTRHQETPAPGKQ